MTGFVDDTTHWINDFRQALQGTYTQTAMYQATSTTAQWWEQLLHASRGKLELPKCFYYNITWQFNDEGEPSLCNSQKEHSVRILSSENGQPVTIEEKSPYSSHKTLG